VAECPADYWNSRDTPSLCTIQMTIKHLPPAGQSQLICGLALVLAAAASPWLTLPTGALMVLCSKTLLKR
jgi:hypothetical protein